MRRFFTQNYIVLVTMSLLACWITCVSAQDAGKDERYNLAVYATGIQNDQALSTSIQTVVQNKTITKLTGEGNYRLIERSNEFLQQIQGEQRLQQSGEVADGQIADIGAGYGAQKVCVVSITIIDKYLYIATRIVDVATKTSYESGDAEIKEYTSIPVLTKALEDALDRMIGKSSNNTIVSQTSINNNNISNTSVQDKFDYLQYKQRLKKEKSYFLESNILAYNEYNKYRTYLITGSILLPIGATLITTACSIFYPGTATWLGMFIPGIVSLTAGTVLLCTMNNHLKKSYIYYLNGDQKTATLQFYPYSGGNNTFGAGLTLRF